MQEVVLIIKMLKTALFYHLESFTTGFLGPWIRRIGQSIVFTSEANIKKNFGDGHTDERESPFIHSGP